MDADYRIYSSLSVSPEDKARLDGFLKDSLAAVPSVLAKIADELRHNDQCGSREPLSDDEYMDDARALFRIFTDHRADEADRLRAENDRLREDMVRFNTAAQCNTLESLQAFVLDITQRWISGASDERRRCGRCGYDGKPPTTAENAMCEAEGGHQWISDASRESLAPNAKDAGGDGAPQVGHNAKRRKS